MLAEIQCFGSEGRNMVCMGDHDPWSIPYGYGMDDWLVFWFTILVLQPKEKLFLLCFKLVLNFDNQTSLENWCEKNDTNQDYSGQVMINHQGWSIWM